MSTQAFSPRGKTSLLAVTATAHSVVRVTGTPVHCSTYQFVNAGSKACYVAWGSAADDASVTPAIPTDSTPGYGLPILSGEIVTYNLVPDAYFSAICASTESTSLLITAGEGL